MTRYEYRVLCADHVHRWGSALRFGTSAKDAKRLVERSNSRWGCTCGGAHYIERRPVGAWERA